VTERESKVGDEKLPRPERIIVYDFVANLALRPLASRESGGFRNR
jgi:hypothetical protein